MHTKYLDFGYRLLLACGLGTLGLQSLSLAPKMCQILGFHLLGCCVCVFLLRWPGKNAATNFTDRTDLDLDNLTGLHNFNLSRLGPSDFVSFFSDGLAGMPRQASLTENIMTWIT